MRALSVQQPWAEMIRRGEKTLEMRTWSTSHRGPLVVCAGGKRVAPGHEPTGVARCVVELVDVRLAHAQDCFAAGVSRQVMRRWIRWCLATGREARVWELRGARAVEARPVKGSLGLFSVDL